MDGVWLFMSSFLVFMLGMIIGRWIRDKAWSENADDIQRIEYKGKLYKVMYAYHYDLDQERLNQKQSRIR